MDLQALIALRKYLTIEKHTDGEIHLKFSLGLLADSEAMNAVSGNKNKKMPKAIIDSNLNLFSRIVVLKYDINSIVPDEFTEFLTTRNRPRFEELAKKYETILSA